MVGWLKCYLYLSIPEQGDFFSGDSLSYISIAMNGALACTERKSISYH